MWQKKSLSNSEEEKQNKFGTVDCIRCGASNWNEQHHCPAKTKKCLNFGKTRHYADLCLSNQRIHQKKKHIKSDSEASSTEEEDRSLNKRHIITKTVQSTTKTPRDGQPFLSSRQYVHYKQNTRDVTTTKSTSKA